MELAGHACTTERLHEYILFVGVVQSRGFRFRFGRAKLPGDFFHAHSFWGREIQQSIASLTISLRRRSDRQQEAKRE